MINPINIVFKNRYHPLNTIEISESVLEKNYLNLSNINPAIKIAPVLKSNAYGHGIEIVAKILDKQMPPFFCVDSLFEAYQLKNCKIKSDILIMGFTDARNLKFKKLPFSYTVFDLNFAKALNRYQPGAKVHIKVDTGMNRLGIKVSEVANFLEEIKKLKKIKIEGLMSHFASVGSSKVQTSSQIDNFKEARKILFQKSIKPKWLHIAASDGLICIDKHHLSSVSNLARVGIALYGANNNEETSPVLSLTSKIVQIKTLEKSDLIGYEGTYKAKKSMKIALLPIGYNDGLDRRLSNKGVVYFKDSECKILGRVSMNITAINVTEVNKIKVGDTVTVISSNIKKNNSITNLAKECDTIPHDLLVHLHAKSIKRIIAP